MVHIFQPLIEVAVETPAGAIVAEQAGADRVELCTGLALEGLTPSLGLIRQVVRSVRLPVVVLVRPRAGNFVYSDDEFEVICTDVSSALDAGAAAVAVGCLNPDRTIHAEQSARLAALAGPGRAVFHRAFDLVSDPFASLQTLIELGYARLLTSGGAATAPGGASTIKQLLALAGDQIELIAGGGIRPENASELVRETGCQQLHGSFSEPVSESLGPLGVSHSRVTSAETIRRLRQALALI